MDMKAEQFERQVQKLEQEKADYEAKVEGLNAKYNEAKKELEDTLQVMDSL